MTHIVELFRYTLKGARGMSEKALECDPNVGVVGDRRFALKRKPTVPDGRWSPKAGFLVCANTPKMATYLHIYGSEGKPRREVLAAGEFDAFNPRYMAGLYQELNLPEPPDILDTEGKFNATDTNGPSVSFLNLASVRALADFMDTELNPRRFRMNVYLEGLEPFEELDWVNGWPGTREIMVGNIPFRVDDACVRCKATEANPATGKYDLPVMDALDRLMRERGYPGSAHHDGVYRVMGILASPLDTGTLRIDDTVQT